LGKNPCSKGFSYARFLLGLPFDDIRSRTQPETFSLGTAPYLLLCRVVYERGKQEGKKSIFPAGKSPEIDKLFCQKKPDEASNGNQRG
jgi:hypothetical protein